MYCKLNNIPMDEISRIYRQEKAPFGLDHRLRTDNKIWYKNILGTIEILMKADKKEEMFPDMK